MPYKHSIIFHVTTAVTDATAAREHTGGWTEQIWSAGLIDWKSASSRRLLTRRAAFLPLQCSIVGVRSANFTIDGNKLVPVGASAVKLNFPGSSSYTVDVPQACMNFSGQADGAVNKVRYTARGFPDEGVVKGEFTGESVLKAKLKVFADTLVDDNWKTLVRDLSQPTSRVHSISAGGLLTTDGAVGFAVDDQIRLIRVHDVNGVAVKGVFRVASVASATTWTLANWTGATVGQSGNCRKDLLTTIAYGSLAFDRVGVKKIGAPLERYRGRRSKR